MEQGKTVRQANFELLRVTAMCMIIGLHALDKGGILPDFKQELTGPGAAAWILEAFFLCAVNVYVLISGYFMAERPVRLKKAFSVWRQVLLYSLVLGGAALLTGAAKPDSFTVYRAVLYVFPVLTEHYWFASAYVFLWILLPFVNPSLQTMERNTYRRTLLLLLAVFCLSKTVLPIPLPFDKKGYDVIWFLCLYLTGGYLKKYGDGFQGRRWKGLVLYLCCSAGIFLEALALKTVYDKTGHFEDIITYSYAYNHLLCFLAAVGLFLFFGGIRMREGRTARAAVFLAQGTFGVYLLHEHVDFRYLWPQWLRLGNRPGTFWFLPQLAAAVILVFAAGTAAETVRRAFGEMVRKKTG